MQLWATVGRFRCQNASCPRKIFCERLPRVARAYSRQTERASEIVRLVGYVAGGLPGQRLLERLSIAVSDDTVLRRIQKKPEQEPSTLLVRNLGVDDWAGAKAKTTERFWLTWTCTVSWIFFPIEPPRASLNGSNSIRKS